MTHPLPPEHRRRYLVQVIVLVIVAAALAYAAVTGLGVLYGADPGPVVTSECPLFPTQAACVHGCPDPGYC